MIRKIGHIILSLLLLLTTIGLVISKHYCGGEMVSVTMFHDAEPCCGMDGCCHNEILTYQVKEDFSTPAICVAPVLAELDILGLNLFETENLFVSESDISASFVKDSPPPKNIQTVLSLKQVYLL